MRTATIQFPDGLTAVISDDGWQCDDVETLEFINQMDKLRHHQRPANRCFNARKVRAEVVANMVGAKLIAWDPIDYSREPPGLIY